MNEQPSVNKKTFSIWQIIVVGLVSLIAGSALCLGGLLAIGSLATSSTETPTSVPIAASTLAPSFTSTLISTSAPLPSSTATDTPMPPLLQTAQALSAQATVMTSYQVIDPRELGSYANQHIGENVRVKITIFNIVDGQDLQGLIDGTSDAIYITTSAPFFHHLQRRCYHRLRNSLWRNLFSQFLWRDCHPTTIINAFYTK